MTRETVHYSEAHYRWKKLERNQMLRCNSETLLDPS